MMHSELPFGCDCAAKGLAEKVQYAHTPLCSHTCFLGHCPLIMNFWSSKNQQGPDRFLGKSGREILLVCSDSKCRHEDSYTISTVSIRGIFICKKCKFRHFVREVSQESKCDCPVGFACAHDNLKISCPSVEKFWSPENPKLPEQMSRGSQKTVHLICPDCKTKTTSEPRYLSNLKHGYTCSTCEIAKDNLLMSCPNIILFWAPDNEKTPNLISRGACVLCHLLCKDCGYEDFKRATDIKCSAYSCKGCYLRDNSAALLFPHLLAEVNDNTDLYAFTYGSDVIVQWKCVTCNHIWDSPISRRTCGQGEGCARCANNIPYTYVEFVVKVKIKHNNKFSYPENVENFTMQNSIVEITCPTHGKFKQRALQHITGRGCRECSQLKSKLCIEIEKWLVHFGINFKREQPYPNLKFKKDLRYDYLILDDHPIECVLEADGKQHFEDNLHGGAKGFEKSIKRDLIKDQYCVDNGISLVRIPFDMIDGVKLIIEGLVTRRKGLGHFICTYKHYSDYLDSKPNCTMFVVPTPKCFLDYSTMPFIKDGIKKASSLM
jgi:hypothetical protein